MASFAENNKLGGRKKGSRNADKTKFAKAVLAGKTQAEAFQIAMNGSSHSNNLIREGCRFAARPDVQEEIRRLNEIAEKEMFASPKAIVKALEEIAFDDTMKPEIRITAMDRLAKAANLFKEGQVEVTVSMADREESMKKWLKGLQGGETEEPSPVGGGEQGEMDNRE